MRALVVVVATAGGLGYVPLAPGTMGSLAAVPLVPFVAGLRLPARLAIVAGIVAGAVWAAARAEVIFDGHDHPHIVIDEVAGMAVAALLVPATWAAAALAFVLFRLFDVVKPFPAGLIDRRVVGGVGVVGDDVVAGVYAGVATRLVLGFLLIDRAVILSTGDELTTGRIADTNAQWLADKLFELGVDVVAVLTVGDYPERLEWAWRRALELGDLVVSTGGIGPTADDLTTETLGRVLGVPLVTDEPSADRMRRFFASRGVEMPLNNLKQALVPEGAVIVPNPLGTAPGYRAQHGTAHVVVLPGVPREMKPMVEDTVLPWVRAQRGGEVHLAHSFQTFGISESGLDELVAGVVDPTEERLSFRASFPEISLRVVVHGAPDAAAARLERVAARLRERLGAFAYGEGATTMEQVVGEALRARGLTLGTAESCTGGLVSHRVTNVPGSSDYFLGSINAYANGVKTGLLGVRETTLARAGAVSEACAGEMAAGARRVLGCDLAVSTTGIAGPDGGTPEKPVGLVCFGLASRDGVETATHQLWGTRDWVKLLASQIALDMVRRTALGLPAWDPELFRRR